MAASFASEAEPLTNPEESFHGLGSISEDGDSRAPSASPEPYPERPNYFDHTAQENAPQRSRTYPLVPSNLSHERIRKSMNRSSTANQPSQKHRTSRRPSQRSLFSEPDLPIQNQSRQSTIDTKNSLSFEDTAVWDEKSILSLDGGGIRGYSTLLILQALMKAVGRIETAYENGSSEADGPAKSSFHPLPPSLFTAMGSKSLPGDNRIHHPETESSPWLPCHYFDYVAGTSTGGLIGIMLGRLRMNIDDCIAEYERLGAKVFGHSRIFHLRSPLWWPRDKYNHKKLEDVMRDVVKRKVPKVDEFPGGRTFAFDENRCRTVVVAFQQCKNDTGGVDKPYLFRTYKNLHKSRDQNDENPDRNPDMAHDIPIWQVARATSAAPTYFKPVVIDGLEYIDGGFGANNPCTEIYDEVRRMNNNSKKCTKIILSIGTGKNTKESRFKGSGFSRYINYLNFARKWASDSQQTHLRMQSTRQTGGFKYFRLNVETGLGQMKLDEWHARGPIRIKIGHMIGKCRSSKAEPADISVLVEGMADSEKTNSIEQQNGLLINTTDSNQSQFSNAKLPDGSSTIPHWFQPKKETLESIRKHTQDYLSKSKTMEDIEECAKLLVEGRRSRARNDPQRWEKACFGAWYQCEEPECPRGEKIYEKRHELRKHLLDKHLSKYSRSNLAELEKALDNFKIIVY